MSIGHTWWFLGWLLLRLRTIRFHHLGWIQRQRQIDIDKENEEYQLESRYETF